MDNIQKTTNHQTPIEIALGIDENGMTTAKKLYEFLELNPGNYARWIKNNITGNEFAEEGVDYFPIPERDKHTQDKNSSDGKSLTGRGNTDDFKLTASFAKKLSMQQKNERGEQARDYFIKLEDKAKELTILLKQAASDPMKLLKLHYGALEQMDKKVEAVDGKVEVLASKVTTLEETTTLDYSQQRVLEKTVGKVVTSILGGKESNAYRHMSRKVFPECNGDLKDFFRVNARNNIPKKRFDEAVEYINNWKPRTNTVLLIEQYNAQQEFVLEGGGR